MKSKLLCVILLVSSLHTFADEFLPSEIFQLDNKFTHHVLIVEKSTHMLHLYENNNKEPKLVKKYQIATGKIKGDKQFQGDKKTPEGIYVFQKFHSDKELIEKYGSNGLIYGAGAFTTNYPNIMDVRSSKTGGGIWLHSTDDDSRVSKGLDSKGCVVAVDSDLKDISQYIDLKNTPIIIKQNISYMSKESWMKNRAEISNMVNNWAQAWKKKDFNTYISQYSKNFHSNVKGNFHQYKVYKKAVFSRGDTPEISFRNISILNHNNYAVVTLEQDYRSEVIRDTGKKLLYLTRDEDYKWKIVSEQWYKLENNQNIAFAPSMRFFGNKKVGLKEN